MRWSASPVMNENKDNDTKYRILMLTTDSEICGTERIILSLLRHLDRQRFEPMLVTMFGPGDLIEEAKKIDVPGVNLRMKEDSFFSGLKTWRKVLNDFKPDLIQSLLIHSNVLGRATVIFKGKIKMLGGISTVYTLEGYGRLYAWIERLTHPLDTRYVVNSELGMDRVLNVIRLPQRKMALVHNGIELEEEIDHQSVRDSVRNEFNFADDDLVVGIVAQLRPAKRHDLLIQASASLLDRFPQLHLLIVGQGEMEEASKRIVNELGISKHVCFAGYRNDARRLLHGMDIFALPSDVEGEPISLLEAMDAGLPVVAARTGGIPEIIENGKSGLIFTPGKLNELQDLLHELLGDEYKRETLGKAAQQRIQERFSAQRMTQEFQELYIQCMTR